MRQAALACPTLRVTLGPGGATAFALFLYYQQRRVSLVQSLFFSLCRVVHLTAQLSKAGELLRGVNTFKSYRPCLIISVELVGERILKPRFVQGQSNEL